MKLTDYIRDERGRGKVLADALGISLSHLSQIAADSRSTNPARCVQIETVTAGSVRRWDLRPDDWHLIWPELIGSLDAPRLRFDQAVPPVVAVRG